jgi:hypothetical protein
VVQAGRHLVDVPPTKPVVRPVPPLRKIAGGTASGEAHTPFALARSGGTPKPRRKTKPTTGRVTDGPACIGCVSYQTIYREGILNGVGACRARGDVPVAARARHACALYQFYGQVRS